MGNIIYKVVIREITEARIVRESSGGIFKEEKSYGICIMVSSIL
jgi:hypothetical protein